MFMHSFEKIALIIVLVVGWLIQGTNEKILLNLPLRSKNLCPITNKTCEDGSYSYLCKNDDIDFESCPGFEKTFLSSEDKRYFIQGHNGMRNKVAKDFNIANMNLLYWSKELQIMAKKYIFECQIGVSNCVKVGKEGLVVNMNYSFRARRLFPGWPGRVVRTWYLEVGSEKTDWKIFLQRYRSEPHKFANFSQMIWPRTEFVGCDTGIVNYGLFVVCFYYPALKKDVLRYENEELKEGFEIAIAEPCSLCDDDRASCSITFPNLCGVDNKLSSRATTIESSKVFYMSIILFSVINIL